MTDQELIAHLWRTGHFFNPAYPDANEVRQEDLSILTLADRVVQLAVASYQQSDANLHVLAQAHHGRLAVADGEVGPATRALAQLPRCAVPDFVPPPGVPFDTGDPELDCMVRSMQRARQATGSGSWPHGCHGTLGVHEVKISYDLGGASAKQRDWWPEIQRRSHIAVAAVGVRLIEVPVGQANIAVSFRPLGGSVIGLAEFNSETCGDKVFCYLSPNYAPNLEQVLVLLLHENGHNWNLEHRAGNIMNPSILSVKPAWIDRAGAQVTYQDNSYPTLKNFFGGLPLDPPQPPTPPLPPVPPIPAALDITLNGTLLGLLPIKLVGLATPSPRPGEAWPVVDWLKVLVDVAQIIGHWQSGDSASLVEAIKRLLRDLGVFQSHQADALRAVNWLGVFRDIVRLYTAYRAGDIVGMIEAARQLLTDLGVVLPF